MDRLDQALVARGLFDSREKAKRAIMAGLVKINGQLAHKPSDPVRLEDELTVGAGEKYVSRGGQKLEHALETFQLDVRHLIAIDLGASTGGFTDCLLQRGGRARLCRGRRPGATRLEIAPASQGRGDGKY